MRRFLSYRLALSHRASDNYFQQLWSKNGDEKAKLLFSNNPEFTLGKLLTGKGILDACLTLPFSNSYISASSKIDYEDFFIDCFNNFQHGITGQQFHGQQQEPILLAATILSQDCDKIRNLFNVLDDAAFRTEDHIRVIIAYIPVFQKLQPVSNAARSFSYNSLDWFYKRLQYLQKEKTSSIENSRLFSEMMTSLSNWLLYMNE